MELIPLIERLEDQGVGTKGKNLFIYMIPASTPTAVLLRNKLSGTVIDYELPGYYKTGFQLIVRSTGYAEAETLMTSAIEALTVRDVTLGAMSVQYMRPKTKPSAYSLSDGNLIEFAVQFEVLFTE